MLVEFSVQNYRSIKEMQTISFVSTGLKSSKEYSAVDDNNIMETTGLKLFKTIGIYGANASGKSNILEALDSFIYTLRRDASDESGLEMLFEPFLYQENPDETETFFQIVFILDSKKYRYGLTIKKNTDADEIRAGSKHLVSNEWLYCTKEKNLGLLFERKGNAVRNLMPNKALIPEIPYKHTVFLNHAAAFDKENECVTAARYLKRSVFACGCVPYASHRNISILSIEKNKEAFLNLLSSFNLKYDDIIIEDDENKEAKNLPTPLEKITMLKGTTRLNMKYHESTGTQKLFDLIGLLIYVFSYPVIITFDELDSNFHPSLVIKLVNLFNNPQVNKSGSQLLFTSHDTNLLSPSIMRRDQFYFTEKTNNNSTRLYSLADLKGIRNDADFAKQYLAGYYGAIPILEDYIPNDSNNE